MSVDSLAGMIIASRFAPTYHGGLAGYQRKLAELLTRETGCHGIFLCSEPGHPHLPATGAPAPWPVVPLVPAPGASSILRLAPRLASRPWTFPLLDALLARCWRAPGGLRPRAIHYVGTGWDFTGFFIARMARRLRVPFTIMPALHVGQWGDDAVDTALYRRARAVFCQTDQERAHLLALGIPGPLLHRISQPPLCLPGGDEAAFRARHGLGSRPCVLFLGRRDEGKGFPSLVAAWPRVLHLHPDAVLLAAGPPDPADHRDSLATLPPDSFRDLGLLSEKEKSDALAACTIFCLPSAHESFGIVYIEAWSFGKPVICGTSPASREIVPDGIAGLWADQSPATLASRITQLLADPAQARRMGEAGRSLQQARYGERQLLEPFLQASGLRP